jgi:hypothetical protein
VFESVGETKVGNDDVAVLVEKQILELEITVDNVFSMEIVDTGYQLRKELLRVLFFQIPASEDMIKEFSSWSINSGPHVCSKRLTSCHF